MCVFQLTFLKIHSDVLWVGKWKTRDVKWESSFIAKVCFTQESYFSILNYFYFSITVDIHYYVSFRCTPQWLALHKLLNDHLNTSCTHLTPYIVIKILLTIFLMPYFTSPWLFYNNQCVLLNSFTFFTHPHKTRPIWQLSKCFVSMNLFLFCLFIYFVFNIQLLIVMYLLPFYCS